MRTATFLVLLLIAVGAGAFGASGVAAQTPEPRFADEVDIEVVGVDVTVLGEDGSPVSGLTLEDFEILDDGQPVRATLFSTLSSLPETPEPAAAPLHLVLLFDDSEMQPADRSTAMARVRVELDRFLGTDGAIDGVTDRVMVARQGAGLRIEQPFTSDRALIEEALDRMERDTPGVGSDLTVRRAVLNEIRIGDGAGANDLGPGSTQGGQMQKDTEQSAATSLSAVRNYAESRRVHALRSLSALDRLASSLGGLPGRKVVFLISSGYDLRPGADVYQAWLAKYRATRAARGSGSVDMEQPGHDIREALREVGAGASASRVAIYTATPAESAGTSLSDSRQTGGSLAAADTAAESLRLLSESTGGASVANLEGIERLAERVRSDLQGGYSLAYPSPHPADGAWHGLEVRARKPGLRVLGAAGYRARNADQKTRDHAAASLLLGLADNPLDLGVDLGTATRERDGNYTVPVTFKVPLARLMLLPKGSEHEGHLSIFLLTQGADGGLSPGSKMEAPIRIANAKMVEAMGQTGVYQSSLRVPPGKYRVAVAVRDDVAAVESAMSVELEVGGADGVKGKRKEKRGKAGG